MYIMASTRNKNSEKNYRIEKASNRLVEDYSLLPDHGVAANTYLPDFGMNPAQIPRNKFTRKHVQVESQLFGIGMTNLEEPQEQIYPKSTYLQHSSIHPEGRVPLEMPTNLVIEKNQRYRPFS